VEMRIENFNCIGAQGDDQEYTGDLTGVDSDAGIFIEQIIRMSEIRLVENGEQVIVCIKISWRRAQG